MIPCLLDELYYDTVGNIDASETNNYISVDINRKTKQLETLIQISYKCISTSTTHLN
jgi:hypothetical protein